MSHDLYIKTRKEKDAREIADYWRSLMWFNPEDELYHNEDTQVYFSAEISELGTMETDARTLFEPGCYISLNYRRPSIFCMELVRHLDYLDKNIGIEIYDPQSDNKDLTAYDRESVRWSWEAGNRMALAAVPPNTETAVVPGAMLKRAWDWNFHLQVLRNRVGERVFVPRMGITLLNGQPLTVSVWGDGMPVILPETDMVILGRDKLRPRSIFPKSADLGWCEWTTLFDVVRPFARRDEYSGAWMVEYDKLPPAIVKLYRASPTLPRKIVPVAEDSVIDSEMLVTD